MKKYLITILLISICSIYGQENQKPFEENDIPSLYTSISIGGIEVLEIAFGKYLAENISIQVNWSTFIVEKNILAMTSGFGLGGSYYFYKSFIFRHLTCGVIYFYSNGYEGIGMKMTVGNRRKVYHGVAFLYEIGMGYSNVKGIDKRHILKNSAILKVGLNINF